MTPFIILISILHDNAREVCEMLECQYIEGFNSAKDLHDRICKEFEITDTLVEVEPITDFIDRVNDQEFCADNYYMSYVMSFTKEKKE